MVDKRLSFFLFSSNYYIFSGVRRPRPVISTAAYNNNNSNNVEEMTYYYYNERSTRQFYFFRILYFRWSFFPTSTRSKSSFVSMKNVASDLYTLRIGSCHSYAYFNRTLEPIGTISAVHCVYRGFCDNSAAGANYENYNAFAATARGTAHTNIITHAHTHTFKNLGLRWT